MLFSCFTCRCGNISFEMVGQGWVAAKLNWRKTFEFADIFHLLTINALIDSVLIKLYAVINNTDKNDNKSNFHLGNNDKVPDGLSEIRQDLSLTKEKCDIVVETDQPATIK